jgi:hypothetical protein
MTDDQLRQGVAWACGTLKTYNVNFDWGVDHWNIELPTGWVTADTPEELIKVVKNYLNWRLGATQPLVGVYWTNE